jgi:hypothetical protein
MNRFVMTEGGRDHELQIVSARIAFTSPEGADPVCKVQVVASHPDLPDDNAVLWFAALKGVRGPAFSLREEVIGLDVGGFHLCEDSALEDVKLDLHLDQQQWRLELSCALFSMGWDSNRFKVSADLELCDDVASGSD